MPSSKSSSKKTVKNAFYYFMLNVRQIQEAQGRRFRGLKEVAEVASPLWNAMSLEEKEPYNRKAREAKGSTDDGHNKFTSLGVSYAAIDADAREQEETINIMLQTIRNTVRSLDPEIALSEFNLKDGLLDTLHSFIDPGKLQMGLRFEAKDWSDKTHGIPYDWDRGEKEYYKLFLRIYNFLTKDKQETLPPVYTMPDSLNNNMCLSAVKSTFNTLCEASAQDSGQFRIFPFPQLFYEIRNKCGETKEGVNVAHVPSVAIVEHELEKDVFSYAKDIGCAFHEEKDLTIHCSLSIVARWVYTICDHCCKHVGISLELGKHCPRDADVNWDYKYSRKSMKSCSDDHEATSNHSKEKNSFMPTLIDHGKLREMREQEYLKEIEASKKAEELRPPRALLNPGIAYMRTNPNHYLMVDNFKVMNFSDDATEGEISNLNDSEMRAELRDGTRSVGAGRGISPGLMSQDNEPAWPVSGRGKFLRMKN